MQPIGIHNAGKVLAARNALPHSLPGGHRGSTASLLSVGMQVSLRHQGSRQFWKERLREKLVKLTLCWEKRSCWQAPAEQKGLRLPEGCWGSGRGAGGSPSPCLYPERLWAESLGCQDNDGSRESDSMGSRQLETTTSRRTRLVKRW